MSYLFVLLLLKIFVFLAIKWNIATQASFLLWKGLLVHFLDILKGEGTSLGQILRKMEPNKVKWVAEKKEFDSHLQ